MRTHTHTHTHVHTTATHTHKRSYCHTPLFLRFVHYSGFFSDSFFRLVYHCIPQSVLFFLHLFLHLFITFVIISLFHNIYPFIPIRKKNSKNSEVITITRECVVVRERGLRRECQERRSWDQNSTRRLGQS